MKLVSFNRSDSTVGTGLALSSGRVLDLQAIAAGFPPEINALLGNAALLESARQLLQQGNFPRTAILAHTSYTFAPPVPNPSKFLLCGRNYRTHAAEMQFEIPSKPAIFGRFAC